MDTLIPLAMLWKDAPQVQLQVQFKQQIQQMSIPAIKPTLQHQSQQWLQHPWHPGHPPPQCYNFFHSHQYSSTTNHSSTHQPWQLVHQSSNTPLISAQISLISKRPNFSIIPKHLPKETYVAAIEEVCIKHPPREADELISDCSCLLRGYHPPSKINITPAEHRAIKELR